MLVVTALVLVMESVSVLASALVLDWRLELDLLRPHHNNARKPHRSTHYQLVRPIGR